MVQANEPADVRREAEVLDVAGALGQSPQRLRGGRELFTGVGERLQPGAVDTSQPEHTAGRDLASITKSGGQGCGRSMLTGQLS